MTRETVIEKIKEFAKSYEYPGFAACANFVTKALIYADVITEIVNYVPYLNMLGNKVKNPQTGDLVIFDQTYDAVSPEGIGPEDDMTHVGIIINAGHLEFIHYSAAQNRPIVDTLFNQYWAKRIHGFIAIITKKEEKLVKIKMYKHDGKEEIILDKNLRGDKKYELIAETLILTLKEV